MKTYIQHICHIGSQTISVDGKVIFFDENNNIGDFLNLSYRHFCIEYPKFFKMDNLSKLAFLTAELLLRKVRLNEISKDNIGIVLGNSSSSIISDLSHQESIQKPTSHFPSPSVFVYTLPNIMMGEISIRHGLSNENTLFINDDFTPEILEKYTNYLIDEHIIEHAISGWIDAQTDNYEAFFYFVTPHPIHSFGNHDCENIVRLQNNRKEYHTQFLENIH
jgi:hypothetical protein